MIKRLVLLYRSVLQSFWFVPVVMSLGAVALYGITISIDGAFDLRHLDRYGLPFAISADGARQLTATIAGSLITVASLVFSLTLVALTVAAGNIGARLLVRYMQHRTIQITLGIFLSGFIFALLTLSAVGEGTDQVPRICVVTAMVFAIAGFLWLAYAFHDLARTIQVDQAVARLSASLRKAVDGLHKDGAPGSGYEVAPSETAAHVHAERSGYVQSVDKRRLLACTAEHDVRIDVMVKPGALVLAGEPVMNVYGLAVRGEPEARIERELREAVILGETRSDLDDPFFCLRLINEIAARALSPGVNDLYTAMACIDNMAEGIEHLLKTGLPGNVLCNRDGEAVVRLAAYDLDDFLDGAFGELGRSAAPHPALVARLVERLGRLGNLTRESSFKEALLSRVEMIADQAKNEDYSRTDRRYVDRTLETVRAPARHAKSPVQQED